MAGGVAPSRPPAEPVGDHGRRIAVAFGDFPPALACRASRFRSSRREAVYIEWRSSKLWRRGWDSSTFAHLALRRDLIVSVSQPSLVGRVRSLACQP